MAQSLSKVYIHIIFSTKHRQNLIDDDIEKRLYKYLGGICKGMDCNPIQIGGHQNHVHVLCTLSRKVTQMHLLEELKKQSSKWIKTIDSKYSNFFWQGGYGIFSVNPTDIDVARAYIKMQHEHHKTKTFQEEYLAFLKKYEVEYDEKYLWSQ